MRRDQAAAEDEHQADRQFSGGNRVDSGRVGDDDAAPGRRLDVDPAEAGTDPPDHAQDGGAVEQRFVDHHVVAGDQGVGGRQFLTQGGRVRRVDGHDFDVVGGAQQRQPLIGQVGADQDLEGVSQVEPFSRRRFKTSG